jgi:hypothetical protein
MRKYKIILLAGIGLIAAALLVTAVLWVAGGRLDVVATHASGSFDALLRAAPEQVGGNAEAGFTFSAPDGNATLTWRANGDRPNGTGIAMTFEAAPFIAAGLDVASLPAGYTLTGDRIVWQTAVADASEGFTPFGAYQALTANSPALLNYHAPMDHYGLILGGGNMFEWAGDLAVNASTGQTQDKDAVFVLEPSPLIAAGVNPSDVDGWAYAQVQVMDNGVSKQVYKFLKPFDIQ